MFGNKILAVTTSVVLAMALCPGAAFASELQAGSENLASRTIVQSYVDSFAYDVGINEITVAGVTIYSSEKPNKVKSVKGVAFDESTKTIKVKGLHAKYSGTFISISGSGDVTVKLVGKNTFTGSGNNYFVSYYYSGSADGRVDKASSKLTIASSGTLVCNKAGIAQNLVAGVVTHIQSGTYKCRECRTVLDANGSLKIASACKLFTALAEGASFPIMADTCTNSWKSIMDYDFTWYIPSGLQFHYNGCVFSGLKNDNLALQKYDGKLYAREAKRMVKDIRSDLKAGLQAEIKKGKTLSSDATGLSCFNAWHDGYRYRMNVVRIEANAFSKDCRKDYFAFQAMKEGVGARAFTGIRGQLYITCLGSIGPSPLKYSKGKYSFVYGDKISKKAFAGLKTKESFRVQLLSNKAGLKEAKQVKRLLMSKGLSAKHTVEVAVYPKKSSHSLSEVRTYRV